MALFIAGSENLIFYFFYLNLTYGLLFILVSNSIFF